jgi:hypothetical protein
MAHEMGIFIERTTLIRHQELKVSGQMHHQKQNQKQTSQGHNRLAAVGRKQK